MKRLREVNGNIYNSEYLEFDEMLDIILELSSSQGYYGRLLDALTDCTPKQIKQVKKEWESEKFTDKIDFIMFLEGGK